LAGAVPLAVGAGPLGAGVAAVGAAVSDGVGVGVRDGAGVAVGKGVGVGLGRPVWAVAVGERSGEPLVGCTVVARGLGAGVLVLTGVGVVPTVGTGGSMR
jgi:hypothetical protein